MAIIQLPKAVGEIQEATLMSEDYYTFRIVDEPEILPNANLRAQEAGEPYNAEKAGHNLVLNVRVEHEDPMVNGRMFTKYLPMPKDGDENRIVPTTGQTMLDWKLEKLKQHSEAFAGRVIADDEDSLSFEVGSRAALYISTGSNFKTGEPESQLDFNKEPRPVL